MLHKVERIVSPPGGPPVDRMEVPGGWIYYRGCVSTFVPFQEEKVIVETKKEFSPAKKARSKQPPWPPFRDMSARELRAYCVSNKISGYSKLNKSNLIAFLENS
tara:strand:+ start:83 stop:394 length:312 start_codon:yes stop_codon:yes gene_type:complete